MSVYRVHEFGLYSGVGKLRARKNYLSFYEKIYSRLNREEKKVAEEKIKVLINEIVSLQYPKNHFFMKVYKVFLEMNHRLNRVLTF